MGVGNGPQTSINMKLRSNVNMQFNNEYVTIGQVFTTEDLARAQQWIRRGYAEVVAPVSKRSKRIVEDNETR